MSAAAAETAVDSTMSWNYVCAADALQKANGGKEGGRWVHERNLKASYSSAALGRKAGFCRVLSRKGDLFPPTAAV